MRLIIYSLLILFLGVLWTPDVYGESQDSEYKGITDPFSEPDNFEFAEDERADKEFFHLGRFIMLGVDIGAGIFTGGLGRTMGPGLYLGGRVVYFFDKCLAFEAALHYASHKDTVQPTTATGLVINTELIPINVGMRYYFDTKSAPKAIAAANPYLAFGGGGYLRKDTVTQAVGVLGAGNGDTTQFGLYGGAGVEFPFYRNHIYIGLDLRYHLVFFTDEDSNLGGLVQQGDRGGDYFSPALTFTYSF